MNVLIADTVPMLLAALSPSGLFFIFGVCGVGCFCFVYFCVPETKGKSLEEIDRMWATETRALSPRSSESKRDEQRIEHSSLAD